MRSLTQERIREGTDRTMLAKGAIVLALVAGSLCVASADVALAQSYDFDSGPQGWSMGDPFGTGFGGNLFHVATGGNPTGFMQGDDFIPGGGSLSVQAPVEISGDLTRFEIMTYDELLPADSSISTLVLVKGNDGTVYRSALGGPGATSVWKPRSETFQTDVGWSLLVGTASFMDVATDAEAVYIDIDVITFAGIEAGFDNVEFVLAAQPVPSLSPAALMVLMFIVAGIAIRGSRAQSLNSWQRRIASSASSQ